jgi:hypothetical protein
VQHDIAVGVAVEPRRLLDQQPAQQQSIAGSERMAVLAEARHGLAVTTSCAEQRLGDRQVALARHLQVGCVAVHDADRRAGGCQQRGLIGEVGAPGRVDGCEGRLEKVAPGTLRRLSRHHRLAVDAASGDSRG